MDKSDFTILEKMTVLYYGLHVAKEIFFSATQIAFFDGMITSRQKNEWEYFFEHEFMLCKEIDIRTNHGRAWLEFKVRHLMDLAVNISFGENPAWKNYSVSFENVFFPFLRRIESSNN